MKSIKRLSLLSLAPLVLFACGDDGGGGETPDASVNPSCAASELASTPDHTFVVSEVKVPTNLSEATSTYALDIDQAENGRKENILGSLIANLAEVGMFDVKDAVDTAVNAGAVALLVNVKGDSLTQGCASVGVYLGDPMNIDPPPCIDENDVVCGQHLDGNGAFQLAADSPTDTTIIGTIAGTQFALRPGDAPGNFDLQINLLQGVPPITFNLVGARVEISSVSEEGLMGGLIGGAITETDLGSILETVQTLAQDAYMQDCALDVNGTCACTPESPGAILAAFDNDQNCEITVEELRTDPLIATFLSPDVDLFDASGNYSPNSDSVDDSLSIGLGFEAVPGAFTPPAR